MLRATSAIRFLEWLDRGGDEDTVFIDGDESRPKPVRWLFGQLWNCSDIVPSDARLGLEMIGIPEERTWTYARAVRWLSQQ
jgi:hypothetical protein